jgi:hypothetical protein
MGNQWKKNGALAFWCPVLKRFISDGERFRQQHWFHNGDGSAQKRDFYNQMEMLDRNEGLANLPTTIDDTSSEVSFVGVMNFDEVLANRYARAEKNGEIIRLIRTQSNQLRNQGEDEDMMQEVLLIGTRSCCYEHFHNIVIQNSHFTK